jgi:predicted ester cyclase
MYLLAMTSSTNKIQTKLDQKIISFIRHDYRLHKIRYRCQAVTTYNHFGPFAHQIIRLAGCFDKVVRRHYGVITEFDCTNTEHRAQSFSIGKTVKLSVRTP